MHTTYTQRVLRASIETHLSNGFCPGNTSTGLPEHLTRILRMSYNSTLYRKTHPQYPQQQYTYQNKRFVLRSGATTSNSKHARLNTLTSLRLRADLSRRLQPVVSLSLSPSLFLSLCVSLSLSPPLELLFSVLVPGPTTSSVSVSGDVWTFVPRPSTPHENLIYSLGTPVVSVRGLGSG